MPSCFWRHLGEKERGCSQKKSNARNYQTDGRSDGELCLACSSNREDNPGVVISVADWIYSLDSAQYQEAELPTESNTNAGQTPLHRWFEWHHWPHVTQSIYLPTFPFFDYLSRWAWRAKSAPCFPSTPELCAGSWVDAPVLTARVKSPWLAVINYNCSVI